MKTYLKTFRQNLPKVHAFYTRPTAKLLSHVHGRSLMRIYTKSGKTSFFHTQQKVVVVQNLLTLLCYFYCVNRIRNQKSSKPHFFLVSGSSALPGTVRDAPKLLKKCKTSLQTKKYEDATNVAAELTRLIGKYIDTTAEDVRLFGKSLRYDECFLESIVVLAVASALSKTIKNPAEKLQQVQICAGEIKNTNKAMIDDDANSKVIVKEYALPLMRGDLRHVENMTAASEQNRCLAESWILHRIELSLHLVGELPEQEQTLLDALKRMDEVFGQGKDKYQIYGHLLNNLGYVFHQTCRHEAAAWYFKQSASAVKVAIDYDDEKERKQDVQQSERNFRRAQKKTDQLVFL